MSRLVLGLAVATTVGASVWPEPVGACDTETSCTEEGVFQTWDLTVSLLDGRPDAVAPELPASGVLVTDGATGEPLAIELVDGTVITVGVP
jgi:hypothetical protein